MGSKLLLSALVLISLTCGCLGNLRSLSRMGPREMEALLKTVDPGTCRCSYPDRCQIAIPDVSMIGIRCQPTTQFCCRARAVIKPYLNPSDWAELFAAVKRLKVEQQLMSLVVNKSPEEVQAFMSSDRNRVHPFPITTSTTTTTTTAPTTTTTETTTTTTVPTTTTMKMVTGDDCRCVDFSECPASKMDFSFGRSCRYGQVRCCIQKSENVLSEVILTENILSEIEQEVENDLQRKPSTTTQLPITTTTTASSTTTETTSTTTSTTTVPTTTTTTHKPTNLNSHRLTTDPISPIKYSSFYRYSMPSVLTKRPQIFFESLNNAQNEATFTTVRPRYQPPPIENSLNREDEKFSVQGYKLPSDVKPVEVQPDQRFQQIHGSQILESSEVTTSSKNIVQAYETPEWKTQTQGVVQIQETPKWTIQSQGAEQIQETPKWTIQPQDGVQIQETPKWTIQPQDGVRILENTELKTKPQNRKIVVVETENLEDSVQVPTNTKIEQEEAYHKYLAQVQLQRQMVEYRRRQQLEQERQSSFVGQVQNAFSSVTNNLRSFFG